MIIAQVLYGDLLPGTLQPRDVLRHFNDLPDDASALDITEASAKAALAAVEAGGRNTYSKSALVRWLTEMTNKVVGPSLRESDIVLLQEAMFVAGRPPADPHYLGCRSATIEGLRPWLSPNVEKPRIVRVVAGEEAHRLIKKLSPDFSDNSVIHLYAPPRAACGPTCCVGS